MEILAFIILALPYAIEALLDYKEWKFDIRDKKMLDVFLRGAGMIAAGIIVSTFTDHPAWQGVLYSLGIYILLFDYTMGYLLKKNIFFLGTTSVTDQFWKFLPWYMNLFVRLWIFGVLATAYYNFDLFIYGAQAAEHYIK
jgi:hypothetical protein